MGKMITQAGCCKTQNCRLAAEQGMAGIRCSSCYPPGRSPNTSVSEKDLSLCHLRGGFGGCSWDGLVSSSSSLQEIHTHANVMYIYAYVSPLWWGSHHYKHNTVSLSTGSCRWSFMVIRTVHRKSRNGGSVGNSLAFPCSHQGPAPYPPAFPKEGEVCFAGDNWTNWDLFCHG